MGSRRSMNRFLALALLAITVVLVVALARWLDPGDKNDRTTVLVTPTRAARSARVFAVAPEESRVDFVTEVRGVELNGVYPIERGTITLEPVGDALRVLVSFTIHVDAVDTGNAGVNQVLRAAMETGDYPLAFYVATSREPVPVTEDEITFTLDGDLEVHNVAHPQTMDVRAQLVGGDMWAIATSDLDLANHGVTFPSFIGSTTIRLTARLQAYEIADGPSGPVAGRVVGCVAPATPSRTAR